MKTIRLWPELFSLPAILLIWICWPLLIEYSGLLFVYSLAHPDPSEQTRVLSMLQFIPSALSIVLFCNAAAWGAIKFNRPDLWTIYRDIILRRGSSEDYPDMRGSLRTWYWSYFCCTLAAVAASLLLVI